MASDEISIGDNVRIVRSDLTSALGHADRTGVCHGFTTPSATGVEVVGDVHEDLAFAVHFGDDGMDEVWFSPDLVELVDHAPGLRATVGDSEFVKADDGQWLPVDGGRKRGRRRRWFGRAITADHDMAAGMEGRVLGMFTDRTRREWLERGLGAVLVLVAVWATVDRITAGVFLVIGWLLIIHSGLVRSRRRNIERAKRAS